MKKIAPFFVLKQLKINGPVYERTVNSFIHVNKLDHALKFDGYPFQNKFLVPKTSL